MKKFYTIALAAAVALTASAAAPKKVASFPTFPVKAVTEVKEAPAFNFDVNKDLRKSVKPLADGTEVTPEGVYFDEYDLSDSQSEDGYFITGEPITIAPKVALGIVMPGQYTVANLLGNITGNSKTIDATFGDKEFKTSTGTVTMPTLTIPAATNIYGAYNIYLMGYNETGGIVFYSAMDIELIVDTDGTLFMPYADTWIGMINPTTMSGFWSEYLNALFPANGNLVYADYNPRTQGFDVVQDVVYGYEYNGIFFFYNFCGSPYVTMFVLDKENNTATALDQVGYESSQEGYFYWQEFLGGDDDPEDKVVPMTVTNKDGQSIFAVDPEKDYWLYANDSGYYFTLMYGATATFDFEIEGLAAVKDIHFDTDNNAPVEYYNLQGVRVNNPAAGQLVIKKQGTEVTKVLVR